MELTIRVIAELLWDYLRLLIGFTSVFREILRTRTAFDKTTENYIYHCRADKLKFAKKINFSLFCWINKARFIPRTLHEPNLIPIKVDPNN